MGVGYSAEYFIISLLKNFEYKVLIFCFANETAKMKRRKQLLAFLLGRGEEGQIFSQKLAIYWGKANCAKKLKTKTYNDYNNHYNNDYYAGT